MRILHVLDHSAPLHSGYTFRTLALMREQRKLGWTPLLMTGPKQNSGQLLTEEVDGWHFYRTPAPESRMSDLPVLREVAIVRAIEARLANLVDELQPAVIHAHSPVLNGIPALRVARRKRLPLVYEVRAFWEDASVEHGTSREGDLRYRATRAAETYVLKRADAITTICHGLQGAIVDRGIPSSRVTVIANAVDVERFTIQWTRDQALADSLGISNDAWVLGFAGSFYGYEGLELAVRAMALDTLKDPRFKLLLVGGGPEDENLRALSRELRVENRVIFTGRVPHAEVDRYYGLIDLLVYPRVRHRLTELVTPLKPLEAMAQGKLVAASDVGGHRELIRPDQTGFLFEPESAEALASCVKSITEMPPEQLEAMRVDGRRFVESERTWRASAAHYADIYDRIVGDSESTSRMSR